MKLPKVMQANFEESLNLLDDTFVKYMITDVEKPGVKEKPILLKILAIVFISILYGLCVFVKHAIQNPDPDSSVPIPSINFLPMSVFYFFLVIFLGVWIITLYKRNKSTRIFFGYINTVDYTIWLALEINLLFLTMFFKIFTILGILLFGGTVALIGYTIIRNKNKSLEKQLFSTDDQPNKVDDFMQKVLQIIIKYGWIVVVLVMIWKIIFPNTTGVRTDLIGFLGVVVMWFVMDIAFIAVCMYLLLPYLLYGYYKNKYSEEYRNWEGKTQLEWYGEKYFNKHIKGTEKEEK